MSFALERKVAIDAVVRASKVCQTVFKTLVKAETLTKKDRSPVTIADYSAQAVVNTILADAFPDDPIIGEEEAAELRGNSPTAVELRDKIVKLSNSVLSSPRNSDEILNAIDRGSYTGGSKGRQWTLDPIDGTKGFLRGEQFAVCLALIVDGEVRLGVMGCPNLPVDPARPDEELGCLMISVKEQGAFQRTLLSDTEYPIQVSSNRDVRDAVICESVEAAHSSHGDAARIAERLGISGATSVRMDSQCKYATLARGAADIYLRLPVNRDYEECIWDHASGALLVHEAGGMVSDINGKPLDFSLGRTLRANKGVVATSKELHSTVLKAVQDILNMPS